MDTEGAGATNAIVVGGPMVNAMAAEFLNGTNADFDSAPVIVKELGNGRVVVAGKTAADTMAAADQFIAGVRRQ